MTDLPKKLSRPAAGALDHAGIKTLEDLAKLSRKQFLALHGVGPASLPTVEGAMKEAGLDFAQK
jgi:DNA-directed RNA polymerase alpha subunit